MERTLTLKPDTLKPNTTYSLRCSSFFWLTKISNYYRILTIKLAITKNRNFNGDSRYSPKSESPTLEPNARKPDSKAQHPKWVVVKIMVPFWVP